MFIEWEGVTVYPCAGGNLYRSQCEPSILHGSRRDL